MRPRRACQPRRRSQSNFIFLSTKRRVPSDSVFLKYRDVRAGVNLGRYRLARFANLAELRYRPSSDNQLTTTSIGGTAGSAWSVLIAISPDGETLKSDPPTRSGMV